MQLSRWKSSLTVCVKTRVARTEQRLIDVYENHVHEIHIWF